MQEFLDSVRLCTRASRWIRRHDHGLFGTERNAAAASIVSRPALNCFGG